MPAIRYRSLTPHHDSDMGRPIGYLHMLPLELWLACWVWCSRRQLRRLSLVCQFFRSVCLPLLLEHQRADLGAVAKGIEEYNWLDRVQHLHRIAVRLEKLAESSYAQMVKSWMFTTALPLERGWRMSDVVSRADVFNRLCDRIITVFWANLGLYRNLTSLKMRGIIVDVGARHILSSLRKLQELTLEGCPIAPRDGVLLEIQRFTIRDSTSTTAGTVDDPASHGQPPFRIVSPARLLHLNLHARAREISPLIIGFRRTLLPSLTHLSLHDLSDLGLFLVFLEQCPQLQSLILNPSPSVSVPSTRAHLDPLAVPLLQTLTAPGDLIGLFSPNRLISTVTVLSGNADDSTTSEDFKNIFMAILRSSVPLRSLCISYTSSIVETSTTIAAFFPQLQFLSMAVPKKIIYPTVAALCGGLYMVGPFFPQDASALVLEDEAAFDNPPLEEISDSEDNLRPRSQSVSSQPDTHSL
ncbi:hypothetical protein B0H19DRAFT_599057 [Mycena capillaripes]|nr:hypothetical protein B0H19DRAFT_599057 [Mycena capillaripes]